MAGSTALAGQKPPTYFGLLPKFAGGFLHLRASVRRRTGRQERKLIHKNSVVRSRTLHVSFSSNKCSVQHPTNVHQFAAMLTPGLKFSMTNKYPPEPKPIDGRGCTLWTRWRIVVHAFDQEQADRLAKKISEFSACDKEQFICVSHQGALIGNEIVVQRELVPCVDKTPITSC